MKTVPEEVETGMGVDAGSTMAEQMERDTTFSQMVPSTEKMKAYRSSS
jgi:hypothetical protein